MPIEVRMPALSPTMTEGNLIAWHKKEGDKIKSGDLLAEIETDKATMEVEAVDEGVLGKLLVPAGTENVKINTPIALILEEGEDKNSLESYVPKDFSSSKKEAPTSEATVSSPSPTASMPSSSKESRVFASPLAKRLAEQNALDIHTVQGTGPRGRIIKQDIEQAISQGGQKSSVQRTTIPDLGENAYIDIPHTNMRKVVARRLSESKQSVPHFYVTIEAQIDELLSLRKRLNEGLTDQKISVNDFMIRACALSLMEIPEINTAWTDTYVRQYASADISVAVSIEGGLITPIIKNAERKSIIAISKEMKDLAERARTGKLAPHEFQGGTFSLSNMGMYGVTSFSAIINPPQACILAVGAGMERPIIKNGSIIPATLINLTLSVDHRVVDGSMGAKFLNVLKKHLENPALILI